MMQKNDKHKIVDRFYRELLLLHYRFSSRMVGMLASNEKEYLLDSDQPTKTWKPIFAISGLSKHQCEECAKTNCRLGIRIHYSVLLLFKWINVRKYRRGNQMWTIQRNWQHRVHNSKTIMHMHHLFYNQLHITTYYN